MSSEVHPEFHPNALKVLETRYLWNVDGKQETPEDMFMRVAKLVGAAERKFSRPEDEEAITHKAYNMMRSMRFMPNTPTLVNASRERGQLSACYVLPIGDSMEEIMDCLKTQAIVQKSGGGTGFAFDPIRERGALIKSTGKTAVGPIPIIKLMNFMMSEFIIQGGTRLGANMAKLSVDHPDIFEFISFKDEDGSCKSFNVSVGITDNFMKAVENDSDWNLISRVDGSIVKTIKARQIFNAISTQAHKTGDPGMLFEDTANLTNPTPHLGRLSATNPCGEQYLLSNEACTLGHMNLIKYLLKTWTTTVKTVKDFTKLFDFDRFKEDIAFAVRFLDNVIEMNHYAIKEIEEMHRNTNRKIGLGIMGLADVLLSIGVPYGSQLARDISDHIGLIFRTAADRASEELGSWRGSFKHFSKSPLSEKFSHMRNACRTNVAPTGSTAFISNSTSTGIEPVPYLILRREQAGMEMYEIHPAFKEWLATNTEEVQDKILAYYAIHKSIVGCPDMGEDAQQIFMQANEISATDHIKMQAVWQKNVDNAISKTINLPNSATIDDVRHAYMLAWKLGCKGITVYRDGCRSNQVLTAAPTTSNGPICSECGATMTLVEGCMTCYQCGYSKCSIALHNALK